jgi:GT2 family glycosyltransferase
VFIDADVTVTQQWHEKFSRVLEQFRQNPLLVTGSRCQPTNSRSLLNKYWYAELTRYDASYINSGHMITSRELFNKIHGFSETLETAEDYDFCQKAVRDGAVISNNPELVVTHNGYPQTIAGFIQRERWHGVQDFESWRSFIQSKIAWFALLNLGLFVAAIIICFTGLCIAIPVYFIIMYAISLLLTIYKFGIKRIDYMLMMPLMFYLYLCGRSFALVDRLLGIKK